MTIRNCIHLCICCAILLIFTSALWAQTTTPATKKETPAQPSKPGDTLVVTARLLELPTKFAPNDLYNYVYIMKYRIVTVEKGSYSGKEILVGHYNPLIPRAAIKDNMDKYVDGSVLKFEAGANHKLTLIAPIDKVWADAIDDNYFDSESTKYFALKADLIK